MDVSQTIGYCVFFLCTCPISLNCFGSKHISIYFVLCVLFIYIDIYKFILNQQRRGSFPSCRADISCKNGAPFLVSVSASWFFVLVQQILMSSFSCNWRSIDISTRRRRSVIWEVVLTASYKERLSVRLTISCGVEMMPDSDPNCRMYSAASVPSAIARVSAARVDLATRRTLLDFQLMGHDRRFLSQSRTMWPPWLEPSMSLLKLASAYTRTLMLGMWRDGNWMKLGVVFTNMMILLTSFIVDTVAFEMAELILDTW